MKYAAGTRYSQKSVEQTTLPDVVWSDLHLRDKIFLIIYAGRGETGLSLYTHSFVRVLATES